jgi:integrase
MARKPKQRANGTGSIYLRAGSKVWQMAFRINGKVIRESSGETSKKKAEDKLKRRLAEIQTGTFCGPQFERTLIAELAEDFFRDYRINGRKSLDDVEARWELHLKPFLGQMKASEVTKDTLRRYVDHRLQQEASNATINRELAALKRMFNLGLGDKVARVPKFPRLQERNVRIGFVEDADYAKLAQACSKEGLWLRSLYETGYRIGWRISELLSLRVAQVDLLNRIIRLEPGQTKNGEARTAPIDKLLHPWLEQCVVGKDSDRFVFSRDENGFRPVRSFRAGWYRACIQTELGRMTCPKCSAATTGTTCAACGKETAFKQQRFVGLIFHDLRRTAIRNMVRAGVSERVAMTISGHLTRSVFDRYNVVSEGDLHEAAQKMARRVQAHDSSITHSLTHTDHQTEKIPAITVNSRPN